MERPNEDFNEEIGTPPDPQPAPPPPPPDNDDENDEQHNDNGPPAGVSGEPNDNG